MLPAEVNIQQPVGTSPYWFIQSLDSYSSFYPALLAMAAATPPA